MRKKIGIDIDGILAHFTVAFRDIINKMYGLNIQDEPNSWDFTNWRLTEEQLNNAWEKVFQTTNFWSSLLVCSDVDTGDLVRLDLYHTLYFITTRSKTPGFPVEVQAQHWLKDNFLLDCPTVIVTKKKGQVAAALELDAFIDDYYDNLKDIHQHSPSTKLYYKLSPYSVTTEIPVTYVRSFSDFVKDII